MPNRIAFLLAGAAIAALAVPAAAQDAASPATAQTTQADDTAAEAIIVTAQRREERLQDVAAAATALSGDSLQNKGIERLDGLQFAVPALTVNDAGLAQHVNIRGIGLATTNPAITNGVSTYVDGVFQPPIVTTNSFYDIASVEVFRGPQGTFVGSNSTGGAIFINSRSPELGRTSGYVEGLVGNYDARGLEGAINLPVSGDLAVRGAMRYRTRDSFYTDIGPLGNEPGRLDELAGRIGALWEPWQGFRAVLKADWAGKETSGYATRPIPGTAYQAYRTGDIRTLDYDSPTRNDERAFQTTLELRQELGDGTVLRSLSGYQNKRFYNLYDQDATNAARYSAADRAFLTQQATYLAARERLWTQEINVISPTDGRLDWIVGGYFQRNLIDVVIDQTANGFPTDIFTFNKKTTLGIFGQATYDLTPKLAVDLGVRYSHYSVRQDGSVAIGRGIPGFPANGLTVADLSGNHKDGRVTGKLSLNWKADPDNLFYAFVARGYKPGGIVSATSEFDPETVIDYEIGWKSTLAGGRVTTQLGAFYYDYQNFQFATLDRASGQINPGNLTGATIKGVEAQVQARAGGFTFDGGVAYVDSALGDATFVDFREVGRVFPGATLGPQCPAGLASNPPNCIDYSPFVRSTAGGPNLLSPKWTFNAGVAYTYKGRDFTITPRANYAYVGPQFTYLGYSPISDRLGARGLLSAQIAIDAGDVSVELYGTNLTDEAYVSGQDNSYEFYGSPREYGVRLRFDF